MLSQAAFATGKYPLLTNIPFGWLPIIPHLRLSRALLSRLQLVLALRGHCFNTLLVRSPIRSLTC